MHHLKIKINIVVLRWNAIDSDIDTETIVYSETFQDISKVMQSPLRIHVHIRNQYTSAFMNRFTARLHMYRFSLIFNLQIKVSIEFRIVFKNHVCNFKPYIS